MRQKIFTAPIQLKQGSDESGEFEAVFATLNVIDHDGDVTPTGAFTDGQATIVEPWNHQWTLPAGKGVVKADDERAWIEGQFFLDTEAGRENYRTVKNMGKLAEWSYTFYVDESETGEFDGQQVNFLKKLDVVGVSPVTRGAGIDTRTVDIKKHGGEPPKHESKTDGGSEAEAGAEGDGNASGMVDLYRTRIEIIEIEAGLEPAEEER